MHAHGNVLYPATCKHAEETALAQLGLKATGLQPPARAEEGKGGGRRTIPSLRLLGTLPPTELGHRAASKGPHTAHPWPRPRDPAGGRDLPQVTGSGRRGLAPSQPGGSAGQARLGEAPAIAESWPWPPSDCVPGAGDLGCLPFPYF